MSDRSLNRATLIGNIGKDPELRKTPQGTSVCTIRMATTDVFRNKSGELCEATDWHSIVLWDRLAEIAAEILKKSDRVYIEGKLRTRIFEKNGLKKHFAEIIASNMIVLEKRNSENKNNEKDSENNFIDNENWSFDIDYDDKF